MQEATLFLSVESEDFLLRMSRQFFDRIDAVVQQGVSRRIVQPCQKPGCGFLQLHACWAGLAVAALMERVAEFAGFLSFRDVMIQEMFVLLDTLW
jgi:hypothetical protein